MENMETNVNETAEVVSEVAAEVVKTGLSTGGKVAVGLGVAGLAAGLIYGGIRLVKAINVKRAQKQSETDAQLAALAATGSNVIPMAQEAKPKK